MILQLLGGGGDAATTGTRRGKSSYNHLLL